MSKYDEEYTDKDFERYDGLDKPTNPKGIFVVPTGSVSILNVSASIKGGTIGSTKDTLNLLDNLTDGKDYEEAWHEPVHYLDKRVTELSVGLNRLADAQSNLSGSSASSIATNNAKTPLTIGTRATNAKAGNTTTISTEQATLLTYLAKGITNGTGHAMKLTLNGEGALVIEINRKTYTIAAD
jgi:hypothetical protein